MNIKEVEPILKILLFLVLFFAVVTLVVSHWQASDGQTFQVMSAGLQTSLGALLLWMKPPGTWNPVAPPAAPGTEKQTETKITETQVGPPAILAETHK